MRIKKDCGQHFTISISSFCFKMETSRWPSKQKVFTQVASKLSTVGIKQLRREDGSLTKYESQIVQIDTTYYAKLLSVGVVTEYVHTSRKCVWDEITPKVTNKMKVITKAHWHYGNT